MQRSSWNAVLKGITRQLDLEEQFRMDTSSYVWDLSCRTGVFVSRFLNPMLTQSFGLLEGQVGRFEDTFGRNIVVVRTFAGNVVFIEDRLPNENRRRTDEVTISCYRPKVLEGILKEGAVTQADLYLYTGTFGGSNLGKSLHQLRSMQPLQEDAWSAHRLTRLA